MRYTVVRFETRYGVEYRVATEGSYNPAYVRGTIKAPTLRYAARMLKDDLDQSLNILTP